MNRNIEHSAKRVILNIRSPLSKVCIGQDILPQFLYSLADRSKIFFICDKKVLGLTANLKHIGKIIFMNNFSEQKKRLSTVEKILSILIRNNVKKNNLVAIVGGGSILDTAGFACSIYKRGVQTINIPTTFLAAIDAGIGGKNGVNYEGIKNILGTIHQPEYIIIDTSFYTTKLIENGVGELIKYAMIGGKKLYNLILKNGIGLLKADLKILEKIIYECVKFKLKIIEKDPYDKSLRHILNFGHTAGHFIESIANYKISHSNAVIEGMKIELLNARKDGLISEKFIKCFYRLLKVFSVKKAKIPYLSYNKLKKIIVNDKKMKDEQLITMSVPLNFKEYKIAYKLPLKCFYERLINYTKLKMNNNHFKHPFIPSTRGDLSFEI